MQKSLKEMFLFSKLSILYMILFAPPEVIHSCGAFGLLVDSFLFFAFPFFFFFSFFFFLFNFGHGLFLGRKGS